MKYLKKEDYFCDADYHMAMGLFAIVALLIPCVAVYLLSGSGSPPGIRGTISSAWHHSVCLLKLCDEDGRCPVWSSKYSKCYMLDSAGVNELDMYIKLGFTRKEYEKKEFCF